MNGCLKPRIVVHTLQPKTKIHFSQKNTLQLKKSSSAKKNYSSHKKNPLQSKKYTSAKKIHFSQRPGWYFMKEPLLQLQPLMSRWMSGSSPHSFSYSHSGGREEGGEVGGYAKRVTFSGHLLITIFEPHKLVDLGQSRSFGIQYFYLLYKSAVIF